MSLNRKDSEMIRLVLGTAQIGLDYGINNSYGKPTKYEAYNLLDNAFEKGIRFLDTAPAYGDSEEIIGGYMEERKKKFNIVTKLPKIDAKKGMKDQITLNLNSSLEKLKIDTIDFYLVHNFSDLYKNMEIINFLIDEKRKDKINKIGISIYEPEELKYIIDNLSDKINVVQIPFNVFDLRWFEDDILFKTKNLGIEIMARSIYLQGLFFANESKLTQIHTKAINYVNILKEFCVNKGITIDKVAMQFVKQQENIDYMLLGCDSNTQLNYNLEIYNNTLKISKKDIDYIVSCFKNVESEIYDPRKWC